MSPPKESLERYRAKRDFERTPEPAGETAGSEARRPRFVVQEHHATRLHWDLRLEHDGVLASWAVPRGIPWSPERDHLAVHTEDHPLEYLEFSGDIPEGEYGAGSMTIWDRGTYEPVEWAERKVVVVLHGERVEGRYALFATRGDDWMIHRMDPPADPDRRPLPEDWRPMEPTAGALPADGDAFGFEVRWAGVRVLAGSAGGRVALRDSTGTEVTDRFPEVRPMGRALGSAEVLLDGVLVAVDRDGKPSHDRERVERRLEATTDSRARTAARRNPAALVAVDLLWRDGHPLVDLPYSERRSRLDDLGFSGPAWEAPKYHRGDGEALLRAAAAQGVRGLVAKRLDSVYRPGERSPDWVEVEAGGRGE